MSLYLVLIASWCKVYYTLLDRRSISVLYKSSINKLSDNIVTILVQI